MILPISSLFWRIGITKTQFLVEFSFGFLVKSCRTLKKKLIWNFIHLVLKKWINNFLNCLIDSFSILNVFIRKFHQPTKIKNKN
jgi:hypothetical protein